MSLLARPDGIQIHYELRGEDGPLVALFPWWTYVPGLYGELLDDLAADHRVLTYDMRGNGGSTRQGPFGFETDLGDAQALLEELGGAAAAITVADGDLRAAALAARRPDLLAAVACFGTGPLSVAAYGETDAMLSSLTVIEAFRKQLGRDQRSALRSSVGAINPQMSDAEVTRRVDEQIRYSPQMAMAGRIDSWLHLDVSDEARSIGDRLWLLTLAGGVGGPWFPSAEVLAELIAKHLPEARQVTVDPGPITGPGVTAAVIREITAPSR